MSKNFTQAPKPKSPLSPEVVAEYERGGVGQDTLRKPANQDTHITPNVGKREPTNKEMREPSEETREITSRLSIDIPESLHVRFKVACIKKRKKMQSEIEKFIVRRTAELEKD